MEEFSALHRIFLRIQAVFVLILCSLRREDFVFFLWSPGSKAQQPLLGTRGISSGFDTEIAQVILDATARAMLS